MRYSWLLLLILFAGCGSYGDVFFVRNYSETPVTLNYRLNDSPQYEDTFYYKPADTAMASFRILEKKEFYPFWKAPFVYYDRSVSVEMKDSFNYSLTVPAGSTVRIGPAYRYSDNISQVVVNQSDTLITSTEEYFYEHKDTHILRYRPKLIGDSYFLLDLFSPEAKRKE